MKLTLFASACAMFCFTSCAQIQYSQTSPVAIYAGDKLDKKSYTIEVEASLRTGDSLVNEQALILQIPNNLLSNGAKIVDVSSDTVFLWPDEMNRVRKKKIHFIIDVAPKDTALNFLTYAELVELDSVNRNVLSMPVNISFEKAAFDFGNDSHLVGRLRLERTTAVLYRRVPVGKRDSLKSAIEDWKSQNFDARISCKEKKFRKRYKINDLENYTQFDSNSCSVANSVNCVQINKVEVDITEGRIGIIRVHTSQGLFMNKGPLSLTNYEKRKYYRLYYAGTKFSMKGTNLVIGDFLVYEPTSARRYFPSRVNFEMDKKGEVKELISKGDPLSFFEGRVYTDGKGLSGEDNGLVLTELHARFIANSNAIGSSAVTMAQFLHLNLNWSKFDSKFDTLNLASYGDVNRSDFLSLMQRSNTMLSAELDLFRGSRVHDLSLKVGTRLYHTKVASLDTNDASRRIFTPALSVGLFGNLYSSRMIEFSLGIPAYVIFHHDQPFYNLERSQLWDLVIVPELEIRIRYPKDEDGASTRMSLFGRVRYYDMPYGRSGNFWQIQTGIQVPISNLFKGED